MSHRIFLKFLNSVEVKRAYMRCLFLLLASLIHSDELMVIRHLLSSHEYLSEDLQTSNFISLTELRHATNSLALISAPLIGPRHYSLLLKPA